MAQVRRKDMYHPRTLRIGLDIGERGNSSKTPVAFEKSILCFAEDAQLIKFYFYFFIKIKFLF